MKITQGWLAKKIIASMMGLASLFVMGNADAAQQIKIRIGPLEREIQVRDLERYGRTGQVPESLKLLKPILTRDVQNLLTRRLEFDEKVVDRFLFGTLTSPQLEPLIEQLQTALPEAEFEELMVGVYLALREGNGLSVLDFISAYPEETLTVDATAAIALGVQVNLSYLQSKLLAPILAQELKVESHSSFRPDFDPSAAGNYEFRERSLIFRDQVRDRAILADFYIPEAKQGQLVILSHGYAANRRFLLYLARHLASHGYTVVALEHPGSNIERLSDSEFTINPAALLSPEELLDRPQDITFLLNELNDLNDYSRVLRNQFNTENVTVIGHSLGGYTALALAGGELDLKAVRQFCRNVTPLGRSPADWLQCAGAKLPNSTLSLRDERVKRAIALNPMTSHLFGKTGLEKIAIPTVIFSSSEDAITPTLTNQLKPFQQLSGEKYFLTAIGATHMSITDISNIHSPMGKSTLVPELMGREAEPLRSWIRSITLAFLKQESYQAKRYQPFLTPEYAQFLSTPKLSFRLTQKVPSTLNPWLQGIDWTRQRVVVRREQWRDRRRNPALDLNFPTLSTQPSTAEYYQGELDEIFKTLSRG
ncbi:MAG: alpha/beta fold hydrolase [Halothece sp. Uz-M2-17]|nr:alpha/beta fold hydrolase [Halothece sp. Uz-M2-17]